MIDPHSALRFQRRPAPVLAEHRPLYKICQIVLVLQIASRGSRSRLSRLQLFNWALKLSTRTDQLIKAARSGVLHVPAWGFDPALPIAIRFAIAERLVREVRTGYELTDEGVMLAKDIMDLPNIFIAEKLALAAIGKNITEAMVDVVAKNWSNL
jgi:hypothetical protein